MAVVVRGVEGTPVCNARSRFAGDAGASSEPNALRAALASGPLTTRHNPSTTPDPASTMSRRAVVVEEFDDDTELPLPNRSLPNTGTRGAILEALSDDEDGGKRRGRVG